MNKRNAVKHLNRDKAHREAMIANMVTSLFWHERVKTTSAKAKVVRSFAEKLITRAKRNLQEGLTPEVILHNKREVMKIIKNREIVIKLFEDIAKRFEKRNGGYTRILRLVNRPSDNTEIVYLELVEKKSREEVKQERVDRLNKFEEAKEKRAAEKVAQKKEKTA
jgi:large subunit ribosomal protein L17